MRESLKCVARRQKRLAEIVDTLNVMCRGLHGMDDRHSGAFSNARQCAIHHIREAVDALAVATKDLEAEIAERVMNGEEDPRDKREASDE